MGNFGADFSLLLLIMVIFVCYEEDFFTHHSGCAGFGIGVGTGVVCGRLARGLRLDSREEYGFEPYLCALQHAGRGYAVSGNERYACGVV